MRILVDASRLRGASQEAMDYFRSVVRCMIALGEKHSLALAAWPGDTCGDPISFLSPLPRAGAAWSVVRESEECPASVGFSPLGPPAHVGPGPAVATVLDPRDPILARDPQWWAHPGRRLVTLTRASLDLLVEELGVPASRVAWIPPGTGLAAAWDAPAALGTPTPSAPYLVTSGTGEIGRFADLLEGLRLYTRESSREVRLIVLERAPASWMHLTIWRGLADVVLFLGDLSASARARSVAGARAFVPSGGGDRTWLMAGEALRAGVPVIAPREPALVEILGEAALYHAPGSVAEMVREMLRCLECRDLARALAQKAIARSRAFSWEASTLRLLDLLDETRSLGALTGREARAPAGRAASPLHSV